MFDSYTSKAELERLQANLDYLDSLESDEDFETDSYLYPEITPPTHYVENYKDRRGK